MGILLGNLRQILKNGIHLERFQNSFLISRQSIHPQRMSKFIQFQSKNQMSLSLARNLTNHRIFFQLRKVTKERDRLSLVSLTPGLVFIIPKIQAYKEHKLANLSKEKAFISDGFRNWKKPMLNLENMTILGVTREQLNV